MTAPFVTLRAGLLASTLLVGACTTPLGRDLPPVPDTPPNTSQVGECDRAFAALVGGALGAILNEENRGRGAVVGAGLGALACSIINAASKQIRSAGDVEGDYRSTHAGQLPATPVVTVYDTAFNAAGAVRAGEQALVVSRITAVRGANEPIRDMVEVLEVFDTAHQSTVLVKAEKRVEDSTRAGAIQNSFDIRLPAGLGGGNYPARTTLYINQRVAGENRGTLRVSN